MTEVNGYSLAAAEGEPLWLVGSRTTLKATKEQTDGTLCLAEVHGPEGMAVPLHTHEREDEAWYLLEGEVTFQVGDRTIDASAGAFAFVPRGTPHGFCVRSKTARFLDIRTPAGFEDFFRACGEEPLADGLQPPERANPERIAEVAPQFGMQIVGPPPGTAMPPAAETVRG